VTLRKPGSVSPPYSVMMIGLPSRSGVLRVDGNKKGVFP
jgi:hypothetical protein